MTGRPYLTIWYSYIFFPEVMFLFSKLSFLRLSDFWLTEFILSKVKLEASLTDYGSFMYEELRLFLVKRPRLGFITLISCNRITFWLALTSANRTGDFFLGYGVSKFNSF